MKILRKNCKSVAGNFASDFCFDILKNSISELKPQITEDDIIKYRAKTTKKKHNESFMKELTILLIPMPLWSKTLEKKDAKKSLQSVMVFRNLKRCLQ